MSRPGPGRAFCPRRRQTLPPRKVKALPTCEDRSPGWIAVLEVWVWTPGKQIVLFSVQLQEQGEPDVWAPDSGSYPSENDQHSPAHPKGGKNWWMISHQVVSKTPEACTLVWPVFSPAARLGERLPQDVPGGGRGRAGAAGQEGGPGVADQRDPAHHLRTERTPLSSDSCFHLSHHFLSHHTQHLL